MRDLASAAGLNVASLYHYFPSKRDLLESVLVEQGFLPLEVTVGRALDAPSRAAHPRWRAEATVPADPVRPSRTSPA